MNQKDFFSLTFAQQDAMVIAMHVRNEMEEFHGKNLSDKQMKELNKIIRTAIFEAIYIRNKWINTRKQENRRPWEYRFSWLVMMMPDYWEIPTEKEYLKKVKNEEKEIIAYRKKLSNSRKNKLENK